MSTWVFFFLSCQGTPSRARNIPLGVIFAPLLLLQATGVLFAVYRLLEKIYLLVHSGPAFGYWSIASKARDCLGFMHHGSRYGNFKILFAFSGSLLSWTKQKTVSQAFISCLQAAWLVVDWWRKSRGTC